MLDTLAAILTFMQSPSTGFRDFIGSYVAGNSEQFGPFLGVAPETVNAQNYMVYDILNQSMNLGFGGVGASYTERPILRFHLYDTDADTLATNLETFTAAMDVAPPSELGCSVVLRKDNPVLLTEPVGRKGERVFHAMTVYEFWINRNKGTS